MTAQVSDTIFVGRKSYALWGQKGTGLFCPREHGLEPLFFSTACKACYVCVYKVRNAELLLTQLNIGLGLEHYPRLAMGIGPLLDSKLPIQCRFGETVEGEYVYRKLALPVPFTGELTARRGFASGFDLFHKYRPDSDDAEAIILTFDRGILISQVDHTSDMIEERRKWAELRLQQQRLRDQQGVGAWIKRLFNAGAP